MGKWGWSAWIGSALLLGGAAVFGWFAWVCYEASAAQQRAREWLSRPPRIQIRAARPGAPLATLHLGDVLGVLSVPRLHLSVMVREGDDARILSFGAGHIPGTALSPGDGNIAIAAHRDTFFRPLRAIRRDDVVTLRTPRGVSRFAVSDVEIVGPRDIGVLSPAPGRDLTLVTCYPFWYLGSAPRRFIVHARRVA